MKNWAGISCTQVRAKICVLLASILCQGLAGSGPVWADRTWGLSSSPSSEMLAIPIKLVFAKVLYPNAAKWGR